MELQKLKGKNVSSLNKYCIILINSNMKLKYGQAYRQKQTPQPVDTVFNRGKQRLQLDLKTPDDLENAK